MGRFILRFTNRGAAPEADVQRIRSTPDLAIVDASPRMLLVEAAADTICQVVETLPGWTLSREQTMPVPDPRPKIRSS